MAIISNSTALLTPRDENAPLKFKIKNEEGRWEQAALERINFLPDSQMEAIFYANGRHIHKKITRQMVAQLKKVDLRPYLRNMTVTVLHKQPFYQSTSRPQLNEAKLSIRVHPPPIKFSLKRP